MEYTLRRLDKSNIPSVAHLLLGEERQELKYDSAMGGIAAFCEGVGVGTLLFVQVGRALAVQSVKVSPAFQKNGIGSGMLRAVCEIARQGNLLLSMAFSAAGLTAPSYRLVAASGLSVRRQTGFTAEISRKALEESFLRSQQLLQGESQRFFSLGPACRHEFSNRIRPSWPNVASRLRYGTRCFDAASSCVEQGGKIKAASLISWDGGLPQISFLYADAGCGRMAMTALAHSVSRLLESVDFDALTVTVTNAPSAGILNKLCGDYEIKERLYTAYDTGL